MKLGRQHYKQIHRQGLAGPKSHVAGQTCAHRLADWIPLSLILP